VEKKSRLIISDGYRGTHRGTHRRSSVRNQG
jgi:hypothetical protein